MTNEYEIVIAGAGIAGLTAALYSARSGRKCLLLTGHVPGGHLLSINKIDGFPGFPDGIAGYDLCPMLQEEVVAAGADLVGQELQEIKKINGSYLVTAGGNEYKAGTLILATGAGLKKLGVPGEEEFTGRGVSHCASCDAPVLGGKKVAVVGSGDSALQEALTLADFVEEVIILCKDEELTAAVAYQKPVQEHAKINIRFNILVEEILGDNSVTGLKIRAGGNQETLEVAAVFVFIGLQPNTEIVANMVALEDSGHIPVDNRMQTELTGMFAAGIIRSGAAGQAVASAGDGANAAKAANQYLNESSVK